MEAKPKKCRQKECIGTVDFDKPITLQIGCSSFQSAYPCNKCKRLHWYDGKYVRGVRKRNGEKAFAR